MYQVSSDSVWRVAKEKANILALFLIVIVAVIPLMTHSSVSQNENPLESWKINGFEAALKDSDPRVLMVAISHKDATRLFRTRGEAAKDTAPRLVKLLKDPNQRVLKTQEYESVRKDAVSALIAMGQAAKDQIPQLVKLINDKALSNEIIAAAEVLGAMGDAAKDQVPHVVALINHRSGILRAFGVEALGAMGDSAKDHIPRLVELLKDEFSIVRMNAVELLGAMGDAAKEQVPRIVELLKDPDLKDPDWKVRSAAVEALGEMGDAAKEQAPRIVELLKSAWLRESATRALVAMGESAKEQIPRLVELLKDENLYVRAAAARALGAMGESAKEQIPRLVELLNDPEGGVRSAAVEALGEMGDAAKEQVPRIVELIKDPDWKVRPAAVETLVSMREAAQNQVRRLGELLMDEHEYVRVAAADVLGAMGDAAKEQVPLIVELLNSEFGYVRISAVDALVLIGAKGQIRRLAELLSDPDSHVRKAAIRALGAMGNKAMGQIPYLVEYLGEFLDDQFDYIRQSAVEAIGAMGVAAMNQRLRLIELLNDENRYVSMAAAEVLGPMGTITMRSALSILSISYPNAARTPLCRFLSHFLGGGDPNIETLIAWLGRPAVYPIDRVRKDHDEARKTLEVFNQAWEDSRSFPELREDLAKQIAIVVSIGTWGVADLPLLLDHKENLSRIKSTQVLAIENAIENLEWMKKVRQWLANSGSVLAVHALFWIILITLYPRYPQIQAIFFWNKWVRRLSGLGYVGLALTWIPFLRTKLFEPLKPSLLADAALNGFDEEAYFRDSPLRDPRNGRCRPIAEAISEITGQLILEGESGVGKTMFLRHLVRDTKRIVVYLPADKCDRGVMHAIKAKLHGQARDPRFLRSLIYSGAMDIYIDGLNEVSADTRAKISAFVEKFFKGNIILGTQPLEWTPPATAQTYILEPLAEDQIKAFLLSRKDALTESKRLSSEAWKQICIEYLKKAFDPQRWQDPQHRQRALEATQRVLSNPMDLTIVASMLARGESPDVFSLQEQQYQIMAADYRRVNLGQEFPIHKFSECVYEMRLSDKIALPEPEYSKELQRMAAHKMVVTRQWADQRKEWLFRHDKIRDFFLVQAFLGPDNERPQKHLGDARFRGVYFQLATLLPLQEADWLERCLIEHAADTKDHTVSDSFVQILRHRRAA